MKNTRLKKSKEFGTNKERSNSLCNGKDYPKRKVDGNQKKTLKMHVVQ
jgi:hypothetical protein